MHRVYVSLGSNVGDRAAHLRAAMEHLRALAGTRLLAASALYETQPRVVEEQPDFINACLVLETGLGPHEFLAALLNIEQKMGRVRVLEKGPRTIDLDILLFDQMQINDPDLQIPHPGLWERAFVLVPLNEIASDVVHPVLKRTIGQLAEACADSGWVRKSQESSGPRPLRGV